MTAIVATGESDPTEYQRCGSCCTPAEACSLWSGGDGCCPRCFHWRSAYADGSMFDGDQNGRSTTPISNRVSRTDECIEPGDVVCPRLGNCTECADENGRSATRPDGGP